MFCLLFFYISCGGGMLNIPLAWLLTRVQVTVVPVVVPGYPQVTWAKTSPSKRLSMVTEGVKDLHVIRNYSCANRIEKLKSLDPKLLAKTKHGRQSS